MNADVTFIWTNLAVGGGILTAHNMKQVAELGITHIINCQAEFDDEPLAVPYGIEVLWCPVWDDFNPPHPLQLERAAQFVEKTLLGEKECKLLVHCAGGVHRGPMFTLLAALVCGIDLHEAMNEIEGRRLIARFPDVYRKAVEQFIEKRNKGK